MITAQAINAVILKTNVGHPVFVYIFDTYALIRNGITYTYITNDIVIDNYQVDLSEACNAIMWASSIFLIKSYSESPTKKWMLEHRIAELIVHNDMYNKIIVADDYVSVVKDYRTYYIAEYNAHMSHLRYNDDNIRVISITKNNILYGCIDNIINKPVVWVPVSSLNLIQATDRIDIYTSIINARARGLKHSTAFSDIIIDHYQN